MFGFGRFIKKRSEKCRAWLLRPIIKEMEARFSEATKTAEVNYLSVMGSAMEPINAKLERLEATLTEYHQAGFFNQIALANQKEGPVVLSIPWNRNQRKIFQLERPAPGRLTFLPPAQSGQKPVFIVTLPKSGTHLLSCALNLLGFSEARISFESGLLHDGRGPRPSGRDIADIMSDDAIRRDVVFPYPLMVNLGADGYQFLAHVAEAEVLRLVHRDDQIILSIRDLRSLAVSYLRWSARTNQLALEETPGKSFPANHELRSEFLLKFFSSGMAVFLINTARTAVEIMNEPFVRLVRFEEITSPDRNIMRKSAEAVAEVIQRPLEDVFQALEAAIGRETGTYSGQTSELGDFWTQAVEDRFVELGGDVLNEQLGYSRHYKPKS